MRKARLKPARRRMARIPGTADLIFNPISTTPGFWIGKCHVMAGVPMVMQTMIDVAGTTMTTGAPMLVETVEAYGIPEGLRRPVGAIASRP